jgi:hypothetical protein
VEDDDDLGQDAETDAEAEQTEVAAPASTDSPDLSKLRKENHTLRERLRRSEMTEKHGADVVELIPTGIPLKEQEALADKLAEKFRAMQPAAQETETETAAQEEPTTQERQLAAVAAGPTAAGTSTTSTATDMTAKELLEMGKKDPNMAGKLIAEKYRAQ